MEKIKLLPLKEQEYMRRLFAGCTEEIRNHMFVMEAEEGKNFIKAGDKCRNIFIILKGRAKGIDMQVQEKIYIFKEFGPGRILGEFECLSGIPYQEIPNFPRSHVEGHAGNLVFGRIGRKHVVAMQGRFHYYEGFAMKEVTYPVYVMKMLGVGNLIVTNACGGINPSFAPGDLMLLTDYINMLGNNPLIGENDERLGVRFPDMSESYSRELIGRAVLEAQKLGISYKKGVYAIFSGPCYETAAEIRAYERLGADAIGMSTVPETIAANYLGMKVLGIACITNMATGIAKTKHTHEEVVRIANESSKNLCKWVDNLITNWE